MFVVVPDSLSNEIDRRLEAEFEKCPNARQDYEHLRRQLITFLDDYGYLPEFSIQGPR